MFLRARCLLKIPKRNVSALYITGDKASENVAILVPYFDFEQKLSDRELLEKNISRRKLSETINLKQLYLQYDLHLTIQQKKEALEIRRKELSKQIFKLEKEKSSTDNNEDLVRKFKNEGIILREDLKALKEHGYSIEDKFIHDYLSLPNNIHETTPNETEIICSIGEPSKSKTKHHLTYENFVDYYDETAFYLKDNAAKFDLWFPLYCVDELRTVGFSQFSNPDFVKSILVEAAGLQLDQVYEVKHETHENDLNLLHLVGNGSMLSYLGFISKLSVKSNLFPLRFVCTGKQYVHGEPNDVGLYGVCQSNAVQFFCAGTEQQMNDQFKSILETVERLYKSLGLHFRIIYVPSNELKPAECLSARIEMYSRHYSRYIEVGNISSYSDYISKRLLFNYKDGNIFNFPHIVSGTICNVTRIIGILLEESDGDLKLPSHLVDY